MDIIQPIPDELAGFPITVLNLTKRIEHLLHRANISTIGELATADMNRLMDIKHFGVKSASDIHGAIEHFLERARSLTADELRATYFGSEAPRPMLPEYVLNASLEVLCLSNRAHNALSKSGARTVRDVLELQAFGLQNLRWLGVKGKRDIDEALERYLVSYSEMTAEQPPRVEVALPAIISLPDEVQPNLVELIIPFTTALLDASGYVREFQILKRRYGIENSKVYTLQEIGDYYNLTRERVRQIEARAVRTIRSNLLGTVISKKWSVPEALVAEARDLLDYLKRQSEIITDAEMMRLLALRYDMPVSRINQPTAHFLLLILGLDYYGPNAFSAPTHPIWLTQSIEQEPLDAVLQAVVPLFADTAEPVAFFDIKIAVSRKFKTRVDTELVRKALSLYSKIERIDAESYQVMLANLPSHADKAFRILYEAKQPLHLRDITREINRRLALAGEPADIPQRSLQSQIVGDPRFQSVGRSGNWVLAGWDHVTTVSTVDLMREFFRQHGQAATIDTIYEYVRQKRPDIARSSVSGYLTSNPSLFTRVAPSEYELASWGSRPYHPPERKAAPTTADVEAAIAAAFHEGATSMPQRRLVEILSRQLNVPESNVYVYLKRSPQVQLEPDPRRPRAQIAHIVQEPRPLPTRKRKGELIREEILAYLESLPGRQALVSDLIAYLRKKKICTETSAVYYNLTRLEGKVVKEKTEQGLVCRLHTPQPTSQTPVSSPLSFPQLAEVSDSALHDELVRATRMLTIDNVDVGLFQLGKIFEVELKSYLLLAREKGVLNVTSHDLDKLVYMIDCVERNKVTSKKHHLTVLREHRNERAHGEVPRLEQRKRLMQHAPYLADLYLEYIIFFNNKRREL